MDNNALSAILAGIETLSRGMARMNAGLDRLDSDIRTIKGDMSTIGERSIIWRVEVTLVLLLLDTMFPQVDKTKKLPPTLLSKFFIKCLIL